MGLKWLADSQLGPRSMKKKGDTTDATRPIPYDYTIYMLCRRQFICKRNICIQLFWIFLIQKKYRLQSMYNYMVGRAASVVSPFYFILLALDGIKKNTQGTLNQERNTRNSESRKIHKEYWIKKDTLQWLLKQGRYTRNSESRRKHKELWIKKETQGTLNQGTNIRTGTLNHERYSWNSESRKINLESWIKEDIPGTKN